jgi:photosystem II stability/assembly factor-like uncharacterized protein
VKRPFITSLLSLVFALGLALGVGGCTTSHLPIAEGSPWQAVELPSRSNPLDLAFTDANHGFLVGSNRLILETEDGGASWQERALELPAEENFRLLSIDFQGQEGWIVGQPGLLLHSDDSGSSWTRLLLDTKLPGDPYLITALGPRRAELATNVGAIYATSDAGNSWQAEVADRATIEITYEKALGGYCIVGKTKIMPKPGKATLLPNGIEALEVIHADRDAGLIRAWVFDSTGAKAEGFFEFDGTSFEKVMSGTPSDAVRGRVATWVQVISPSGEGKATTHMIERTIDGVDLPDAAPLTFKKVR